MTDLANHRFFVRNVMSEFPELEFFPGAVGASVVVTAHKLLRAGCNEYEIADFLTSAEGRICIAGYAHEVMQWVLP